MQIIQLPDGRPILFWVLVLVGACQSGTVRAGLCLIHHHHHGFLGQLIIIRSVQREVRVCSMALGLRAARSLKWCSLPTGELVLLPFGATHAQHGRGATIPFEKTPTREWLRRSQTARDLSRRFIRVIVPFRSARSVLGPQTHQPCWHERAFSRTVHIVLSHSCVPLGSVSSRSVIRRSLLDQRLKKLRSDVAAQPSQRIERAFWGARFPSSRSRRSSRRAGSRPQEHRPIPPPTRAPPTRAPKAQHDARVAFNRGQPNHATGHETLRVPRGRMLPHFVGGSMRGRMSQQPTRACTYILARTFNVRVRQVKHRAQHREPLLAHRGVAIWREVE